MKQSELTPLQFFEISFGKDSEEARDYTGRTIKKSEYNQSGADNGWVIELLLPKSKGGDNSLSNVAIVSCAAHTLRGGSLTYSIDGNIYQIQRKGRSGYEICKISGSNAEKGLAFWDNEFGRDISETVDFAGREIKKSAYLDNASKYGWDIDHIQPLSRGGAGTDDNKQITNILTNRKKAGLLSFTMNKKQYRVQKNINIIKDSYAGGYDYSNKTYCIIFADENEN